MKEKKEKKQLWKKILLIFAILMILGIGTVIFLLYGPYSGFREWLITTAMTTMRHQYLATWFYDDETIQEVLAKNKVQEVENKDNKENETQKESVKLIKFEEIKNIFKSKKTIPKEDLKKINQPVFHNILMAIAIMVYFIFLILGFYNIKNDIYQTDLKVFAMCILFIAIILLEKAYKQDSGKLAIFGIESIIISIITVALIYINIMLSANYISIVLVISYILAIYYVLKSIIIYIRERKKYFVDGIKEMINQDDV